MYGLGRYGSHSLGKSCLVGRVLRPPRALDEVYGRTSNGTSCSAGSAWDSDTMRSSTSLHHFIFCASFGKDCEAILTEPKLPSPWHSASSASGPCARASFQRWTNAVCGGCQRGPASSRNLCLASDVESALESNRSFTANVSTTLLVSGCSSP